MNRSFEKQKVSIPLTIAVYMQQPPSSPQPVPVGHPVDKEIIQTLLISLTNSKDREMALAELSKRRESIDNLAILLWFSTGTNLS